MGKVILVNKNEFKFELVDEVPMVNSLDIAERFEKRHDVVIKTIENDIAFKEFLTDHKIVVSKYKDKSGKFNKYYWLDRDAFSYFVMGFTGEKAKRWKLDYIRAFNEMERLLKLQFENENISNVNSSIEPIKTPKTEEEVGDMFVEVLGMFGLYSPVMENSKKYKKEVEWLRENNIEKMFERNRKWKMKLWLLHTN